MTKPQICQIASALVKPVFALPSKSSAIILLIHTLPASAIFYISIQHNVSEKFLPGHTFSTHNQCIYHIHYMFCK